ncbi:hypothetical protein ACX0G9_29775 [Flavitalea flava]
MLKQFYIVFENRELDSFSLKHIQYNIQRRIRELKYVTYRRLDILLVDGKDQHEQIERDDKKTANMKCYIDSSLIESIADKKSIKALYTVIFKGLEILWAKSQWDIEDLNDIYRAIEKDDFFSSVIYGKTLVSPDKKHNAEFLCEIYPGYTDYYLRFIRKKEEVVHKIHFLHGHPDPGIFFNFFSNRIWRDSNHFLLSDINKEIFYIFNVNNPDFSIEYRPINNSLEECKNYVAAFQAGISQNERLRLLGLPAK